MAFFHLNRMKYDNFRKFSIDLKQYQILLFDIIIIECIIIQTIMLHTVI
jgi:hypothetical protein